MKLPQDPCAVPGGAGLAVDPADAQLVTFHAKYGFIRVEEDSLRMFFDQHNLPE